MKNKIIDKTKLWRTNLGYLNNSLLRFFIKLGVIRFYIRKTSLYTIREKERI